MTHISVNNLNNKVLIKFLKYIQITKYKFLNTEKKLLLIIINHNNKRTYSLSIHS